MQSVGPSSMTRPKKETGDAVLPAQIVQQIENLVLGGDVQGSDSLLLDQQLRLEPESE